MNNDFFSQLCAFYQELHALKRLCRQGWLRYLDEAHCESVADHSFAVAMLCCVVGQTYFPELDYGKVMHMALIHDLGEVYVGDLTPYSGIPNEEKKRRELAAVEKIFDKLPQGENYIRLWQELTNGTSAEARFVKEIDSLEMALQAGVYAQERTLDLDEFFAHATPKIVTPALRQILQMVRDKSREKKRE
jgi:putative hydrolase of HD superfamily